MGRCKKGEKEGHYGGKRGEGREALRMGKGDVETEGNRKAQSGKRGRGEC